MSILRMPQGAIRALYQALAIYSLCIAAWAVLFMAVYCIPFMVISLVIEVLPRAAHADPINNQTTDSSHQPRAVVIDPALSNPRSRLSPGIRQYLLASQTLSHVSNGPTVVQHNNFEHTARSWPDVLGRTGFSGRPAQVGGGTLANSLVSPQGLIRRNWETGGLYASSAIGGAIGYVGEERLRHLWTEYAARGSIFWDGSQSSRLYKVGGVLAAVPSSSGGLRGAVIGASSAGMLWKWWAVELIRPVVSGPQQ